MRTLPLEFQYSDSKITISGRDNISIRLTTLNFPTIAIYHQFHPPLIPGNGTLTKRFKTLQNVRFTKTSNTSGLQKLFKNVCKKHPYSVFVEICRFCCSQGCESRRQTLSSISRPRFRDFGKVSALSRSLTLLGKKVSTRSRPLFGFSRPNPAEIETSIANR